MVSFVLAGCKQDTKPPEPAVNAAAIQDVNTGTDELGTVPPGPGSGTSVAPGPGPRDSTPLPGSGGRTYTVKAKDGLMSIARTQLGNQHRWKEILALNPDIKDPNHIKVGQVIKLPAK